MATKTLSDLLIAKGTGYSDTNTASMNLSRGGQSGQMPVLGAMDGGEYAHVYVSNQAYVRRNVIPILIAAPTAFTYLPNSEEWIKAYKHLLETAMETIDGLNTTLTVDSDDHPFGGGGEQQSEPTNSTYSQSSITYTWKEKSLKSVVKFWDKVIRYTIMDPFTKKPLVANLDAFSSAFTGAYTPDFYAGTMLFIEPDITQLVVVDAWYSTNFYPSTAGDRTGSRDLHSAGDTKDISIEFKNITINNEATHALAATILPTINTLKYMPDTKIIVSTAIDSSVTAQTGVGYSDTPSA